MKKILLITLLLTVVTSFGQSLILYEPFDYTIGNPITGSSLTGVGTWFNYSNGSPDDGLIASDPGWGLVSLGLPSPTGALATYQGSGGDYMLPFTAYSGEGNSIYFSFLIDIVGFNTTAGHVPTVYRQVNLAINNPTGNVGSGLVIRAGTVANTFNLGYQNSDNTASVDTVFSPTNYPYTDLGDGGAGTVYNNQFFIVVKYTIASAGGVGQMWINPVISPTEPTPTLTHTAVNKIRTSFEGIMLQQHSNNNTPLTRIDEIRVGTSWAAVVGASLSVSKNEIEGLEVYPNPAKDYLIIKSNISKITTVEMYNVLGAKVVSSTALVDNRLNVSSLAKGVYVLKINADASSSSRKIVIE